MYSLVLSLVLSSSNVLADKLNVEVDGEECKLKTIYYDAVNNYVHAIGNCQFLYDICTDDFCRVKKIGDKELNFGLHDNVGKK
jgi:hypothetical protein